MKPTHSSIHFIDAPVAKDNVQKHLGLLLDKKFNINDHINEKLAKAIKWINVIRKLSNVYPRHIFVIIYKSSARPHHGDITVYDQPKSDIFGKRIENIQYNAALAITGTIEGMSQTKLHHELGLDSLLSETLV